MGPLADLYRTHHRSVGPLSEVWVYWLTCIGPITEVWGHQGHPPWRFSAYCIVATQFWILNSRTFQDFQGHFRQISRTYSIKIPGYSRTKNFCGPIFKDRDRQIQGHHGRTRSRANEPDRPTITQIWVHANQGSLNHFISGWLHKQTSPPPSVGGQAENGNAYFWLIALPFLAIPLLHSKTLPKSATSFFEVFSKL